jgi:hypothetical protein
MALPVIKTKGPGKISWTLKITGVEGIEPSSGVLETLILPMNYTPMECIRKITGHVLIL